MRLSSGSRALLGLTGLTLAACSSLLGLDDLERVSCIDDCSAGTASDAGSRSKSGAGSSSSTGGASNTTTGGKAGGATAGSSGNSGAQGGTASNVGDAGAGGAEPAVEACPGGPAPPAQWQEHWYEHDLVVTRASYDDCVAVYADADMDADDLTRLSEFLTKAWRYNLETYGKLGDERLFAVFHQSKYIGAHAARFFEASHDFRNVIDDGENSFTADDYDQPAHALSFVVEATAAHAKRGSPAGAIWGNEAFGEIYKYDLYLGLGMQAEAEAAFDQFEFIEHGYPVDNSFWFADFYYPVWRDHGGTQMLVKFFQLIEQYYPAPGGVMADMTWGEYIHFMSGAAGTEVKTQATFAFGWYPVWDTELAQAKADFPQIKY